MVCSSAHLIRVLSLSLRPLARLLLFGVSLNSYMAPPCRSKPHNKLLWCAPCTPELTLPSKDPRAVQYGRTMRRLNRLSLVRRHSPTPTVGALAKLSLVPQACAAQTVNQKCSTV